MWAVQMAPPVIHSFEAQMTTSQSIVVRADIENATEYRVLLNGTRAVWGLTSSLVRKVYILTADVYPGTYATKLGVRSDGN